MQQHCMPQQKVLRQAATLVKQYQVLMGKLQHTSLGIPGGHGLFSPLQMALLGNPTIVRCTPFIKEALLDWITLIRYMQSNPVSVCQLVKDYPAFIGHTDACMLSAGGVWTSGLENLDLLVCQYAWPDNKKAHIKSPSNPEGDLFMNDLELIGLIMGYLIL
eukprot:12033272-Ditylum_brightwellii.AAC.1